jgi:hypothetical protein
MAQRHAEPALPRTGIFDEWTVVSQPKQPVRSLAGFRARMPRWRGPSATLLRKACDESL